MKRVLRLFSAVALAAIAIATTCAQPAAAQDQTVTYPQTPRVDHTDDYHGTSVADPYRWLEDDARTSDEVRKWVEDENRVTFAYLNAIPERDAIKKRLTALWNYPRIIAPDKTAGRYFFSKNDGLQNQNVLYVADALDFNKGRVLIDPNTWSKDGTVALGGAFESDDAQWLAYGIAEAGSDWRKFKIKNINTGEDLPETIEWVKFSGASWTPDSKGFFYSRYDAPSSEGGQFHNVNKFQKLYYHRIGTPQSQDVLVYHNPAEPDWGFGGGATEDGRYLIISVTKGTDQKNRVLYKDLSEPYGLPIDLIDTFEADYSFVGNDGPVFYFRSDLKAPRGQVIAIDIRNPQPENRKVLIPESADTLTGVNLVGNMFVCTYLKDAATAVKMFDVDGRHVRDVEFPGLGSAGGFGGRRSDTETFYTFSSYATPPSIYRYDLLTGKSEMVWQAKVDMNSADYEVKQVFYQSKDGTKVPMFITHRKGVRLDGNNPTLLYGYGGFNIPMTPAFSTQRVAWLEMGGVYAVACMRGGGEYGEEWHKAGTKLNKQNVFDDFIAAAEWLIANKYTNSSRLAIQGGSNGGLLVGACMTQRPDLFGVCLPAVGVMDMLRFHKFTIGWAWCDDYGSSDNPDEFMALRAYSPYHNIKPGTKYPATMVTTADTDDRVVPGHSFKFAAALQAAQAGSAPVLIRIETRAGHGAGKPTEKIIEEAADILAFTAKNMRMELSGPYK
jgi:prolyl oligopeptidase